MSDADGDRYVAIHHGFVAGDAAALSVLLGGERWFDWPLPEQFGGGHALVYAIYWSPPAFIASMIERGADVNFAADDGFPALLAALSRDRAPRHEVLATLLAGGADVNARGINDWTPLHHAVSLRDAVAIRMLLAAGADTSQRTRIDQYATALDDARAIGFDEAVELLEAAAVGGTMGYELRRATSAEDLAAMHRLRRDVLFARRGRAAIYNDQHPDDAVANHLKFLLVLDGERIGTARLDLVQGIGKLRLVVIAADRQRQGHGSAMEQMIAGHAHRLGVTTLLVNSAPDAVGFHEKRGWQRELWDPSELQGMASDCVQMAKYL